MESWPQEVQLGGWCPILLGAEPLGENSQSEQREHSLASLAKACLTLPFAAQPIDSMQESCTERRI